MRINKIVDMFKKGNVCVYGLRGKGKDMLFANVIARRRIPYVSNMDYKCKGSYWIDYNPKDYDCGKNDYTNFISGNINHYQPPILDGMDIYISDAGIYFPSQYCNELNRQYKYLPTYFALSRQMTDNNIHINAQSLNRVWDKIREQSDTYIMCRWCKVIGNIVIQSIRIYELYESALNRVPPFRMQYKLTDTKEIKRQIDLQRLQYTCQHGEIKNRIIIYVNKSKYDTREFRKKMGAI